MGDDIFFGRKDLIGLVKEKLNEAGQESILIDIYGIGGIGKSALLRRLLDLTKYSFLVDFSATELDNVHKRLRAIAARAKAMGLQVKLTNTTVDGYLKSLPASHSRDIRDRWVIHYWRHGGLDGATIWVEGQVQLDLPVLFASDIRAKRSLLSIFGQFDYDSRFFTRIK